MIDAQQRWHVNDIMSDAVIDHGGYGYISGHLSGIREPEGSEW
jgi:hypothetical protein